MVGGQTHWYYTGAACTHGSALRDRHKSIGRATWRTEGFISLDAAKEQGMIETVLLSLPHDSTTLQLEVVRTYLTSVMNHAVLAAAGCLVDLGQLAMRLGCSVRLNVAFLPSECRTLAWQNVAA